MKLTEAHVRYITGLERKGRITAEAVLTDAKRPDSPLHDLYDWDVQKAADAHWLDRTRHILRLVYVVHTENLTIKIPGYLRDPGVPSNQQGYITPSTLRVDPALARRALINEFGHVASALMRAQRIAIGLDMENDIAALLAQITGLRAILRADPPVPTEEQSATSQ